MTCLQESEESESCASAGLECEADGKGGRGGDHVVRTEHSLQAWEVLPDGQGATKW